MSENETLGIYFDASQLKPGATLTVRSFNDILDAAKRTDAGLAKTQRTMDGTGVAAQRLGRGLAALGGYLGARQIIDYADSWKLTAARLSLVTKANENLITTQDKLFQSAQANRASYESVATLYARTARAAGQLGVSQGEVLRFTDLTTKALRINGATTGEAASVTLQLSQALASGRLQGDEFRSVMENAPPIADALAKSLKVTRGELYALAKAGKLSAAQIISSLNASGKELDAQAAKLPTTVSQGFQVLTNSLSRFIGVQDQALGATQRLGAGLVKVGEFFDTNAAGVQALVAALGTAGLIKAALGAAQALRGVAAAQALAASSSFLANISGLGAALKVAALSARAFWVAATGPVGLAVAAIVAVGAAVYKYRKEVEEAAKRQRDFVGAIGDYDASTALFTIQGISAKYLELSASLVSAQIEKKKLDIALAQAPQSERGGLSGRANALKEEIAGLERVRRDQVAQLAALAKRLNQLQEGTAKKGKGPVDPALAAAAKEAAEGLKKLQDAAQEAWAELANPGPIAKAVRDQARMRTEFVALAQKVKGADAAIRAYNSTLAKTLELEVLADLQKQSKAIGNVVRARTDLRASVQGELELREQLADAALKGEKALDKEQKRQEDVSLAVRLASAERISYEQALLRVLDVRHKNERAAANQKLKEDAEAIRSDTTRLTNAQKYAAFLKDVSENTTREIQSSFSGFIEDAFSNGLKSAQAFFGRLKQLALKTFAELLTKQLTTKLAGVFGAGIGSSPGSAASGFFGLNQGQVGKLLGGAGIGLAGFGIGSAIGSATGSKSKGALGGAAGGAVAGAALGSIVPGIGTAVGAIIGGVTGFIGGLTGGAKKAKEEARAMRTALAAFTIAMAGFSAVALGTSNAVDDALRQSALQVEQLKKQATDSYKGKKNEPARNRALANIDALAKANAERIKNEFIVSIDAALNTFKPGGEFINQRAEIERQYAEELRSAAAAGLDAAKITELYTLRLNAVAEAEAKAAREAEGLRLAFTANLDARAARLKGDERGAVLAELNDQARQEKARALELLKVGSITEEQFKRLAEIIDGELADAIKKFDEQAKAAADALALAKERAFEDLRIREIAATQGDQAAEQARRELLRKQEIQDATDEVLKKEIERIHVLEETARRAKEAADAERDRADLTRDLTDRLLRAQGNGDGADAARRAYEAEELLKDARLKGLEALAEQVLAEEELARQRQKAADIERFSADLRGRLLRAGGNSDAAETLARQIEAEDLLTKARALGLEGLAQQVLAEEALAREREKSIRVAQALEDLSVRALRAGGQDRQADILAQQLAAQRELAKAVEDYGAQSKYVAELQRILALEAQRVATSAIQESVTRESTGAATAIASATADQADRMVDLLAELVSLVRNGQTIVGRQTGVYSGSGSSEDSASQAISQRQLNGTMVRVDLT